MPGWSNTALIRLTEDGDPTTAALAAELLEARRALREESVRCAELAARFSSEASGAIRESAQLRENRYSIVVPGRRRPATG